MEKRSFLFVIVLSISFAIVHFIFSPLINKNINVPSKSITTVELPKIEADQSIKKYYTDDEKFYVLENDYMQVVFSNIGGAISEINLPFSSEKNKNSIIKEVKFDKIFTEDSYNDRFPSFSYFIFNDGKMETIEKGKLGGYYPLLRRSIFNEKGKVQHKLSPEYYATSINNDDTSFEMTYIDAKKIVFKGKDIIKTYFFDKKDDIMVPYCLNLKIDMDPSLHDNIFISSGLLENEINPSYPFSLKCRQEKNNKYFSSKLSLPKDKNIESTKKIDWASNFNGFFGIIIDPLNAKSTVVETKYVSGINAPTRYSLIDKEYDVYPEKKYPAYEFLLSNDVEKNNEFRIYAGPFQSDILKIVDGVYRNPISGYIPNYQEAGKSSGFFSIISVPFANFLQILITSFYKLTHSWGIAIILLAISIRIMLSPLNNWTMQSMRKMQAITPKINMIKERYKHDEKKQKEEVFKFYKEQRINPLTSMGCLPLIIQLPFLMGVYSVLRSTFDLRGVSFIPGWIDNLTAPDIIFTWNYPVFFLGNEFHLLPIILAGLMFLQQKTTMKTPDLNVKTDQKMQQGMAMYIGPVIFLYATYSLPSGLNIYWISYTFLTIIHQLIKDKYKKSNNLSYKSRMASNKK